MSITAIIRQPSQSARLEALGVKTAVVKGLDDSDGLINVASNHDIVINVATGQHSGAPKALIKGLGQRSSERGTEAYFLHVGCLLVPRR